MTDSPLDAAPVDGLARAFRLPVAIMEDPELLELHAEIVARLRREAQGLPMNTVQQLLLERIAANYVIMKHKEETGGFARTNEQKDFNTFWLSMTQEFNRLLTNNDDRLREAMLIQVQDIVVELLGGISDPTERKAIRANLAGAFANINL